MNSHEMHVMFRAIAQQMGMQNVRGILDEQIDICLNAAQIEKIREYVITNATGNNYINPQVVYLKSAFIPSLNAIRTLIHKEKITSNLFKNNGANDHVPYVASINKDEVMFYTSFEVVYDNNERYECRIIPNEYLSSILMDYCNRPTFDFPIATVYNDDNELIVNIYNRTAKRHFGDKKTDYKPKAIEYFYIKNPPKIKYDERDNSKNVNCILPEYLHSEIVERGAQKYLISLGLTSKPTNNSNKNQ